MEGTTKLNSDFQDLLRLLSANGVEYVVVGSVALAAHGSPRYTKDLDLFFNPTPENAQRLVKSLDEFGFAGVGLTPEELTRPGVTVQLGHEPVRVDLLSELPGVTFEEVWRGRILATVDDMDVPVIGKAEFIRNKVATGRWRDLGDIESIGEDPAHYGFRPIRD